AAGATTMEAVPVEIFHSAVARASWISGWGERFWKGRTSRVGRATTDSGGAAPVKVQKDCSRGRTSSAARLSATTSTRGRPPARCSRTVARALAVGVRPETLTRPVPSFRWEAARDRGARFSASAKSSRTKGRTIALLFYQQAAGDVVLCVRDSTISLSP